MHICISLGKVNGIKLQVVCARFSLTLIFVTSEVSKKKKEKKKPSRHIKTLCLSEEQSLQSPVHFCTVSHYFEVKLIDSQKIKRLSKKQSLVWKIIVLLLQGILLPAVTRAVFFSAALSYCLIQPTMARGKLELMPKCFLCHIRPLQYPI